MYVFVYVCVCVIILIQLKLCILYKIDFLLKHLQKKQNSLSSILSLGVQLILDKIMCIAIK